jgi:hypothetical protein
MQSTGDYIGMGVVALVLLWWLWMCVRSLGWSLFSIRAWWVKRSIDRMNDQ